MTVNGTKYLVDETLADYEAILTELGMWTAATGTGVKLDDGSYAAFNASVDLNGTYDDGDLEFEVGTTAATGYYMFTPTVMTGWTVVTGYPDAVQPGQKFTIDVQRDTDGVWNMSPTAEARFTTGATVSGVTADSVRVMDNGSSTDHAVVRVSFTVRANISTDATYTTG